MSFVLSEFSYWQWTYHFCTLGLSDHWKGLFFPLSLVTVDIHACHQR